MATIVWMRQPLVGQSEHRRAEQPDDEDAQPERRPAELLERDGSGPGADEDRQAEHGRIRAGVLAGAPWRRDVGGIGAAGRNRNHLPERPHDGREEQARRAVEHGHATEPQGVQHRTQHHRPAMRPPRHRQVERHLDQDDEHGVHHKQQPVEGLAVMEIADQEERHCALVLIEHHPHKEDAGEKHDGAGITQHTGAAWVVRSERVFAEAACRERREGPPCQEGGQHETRGERARTVHDKEQGKRDGREKTADRRPHAHPEVDPEPVDGDRHLALLGLTLGMSVGPAVGGFLATVSFPLLFVVDGASALAAGLVLTALLAWRPLARLAAGRLGDDPLALENRPGTSVLRDPRAVVFLTGVFFMGVVFYQHEGAMPLFLVRDLHYRESFYGLLFVVNTVLIVLVEVPLNLAMAGWSHRWTMVLGAVLYALGFGSMAVLHSAPGLLLSAVVWTFGEMIAIPASSAYAADIAPPGRTGQHAGAYASMFSLAILVGPWAGAIALEQFGGTALWLGILVIGLLSAAVLTLTDQRLSHPDDSCH